MLSDFSLHLTPGETVAMVGRTASGKTTVSRLLPRFYDVTAGRVAIDGHDVREITMASLRAHIGVVIDEPFLFSISIRDNIAYGLPDAGIEAVRAAARSAGAEDFILALPDGYDTVVGERGYRFSGGEKQRIAIARTVLRNPPVLVLDEATSALDTETERQVQTALDDLARGRTTIAIAHRLSTVRDADQILVLDHGRIVERGTHEELLELGGRYAALASDALLDPEPLDTGGQLLT